MGGTPISLPYLPVESMLPEWLARLPLVKSTKILIRKHFKWTNVKKRNSQKRDQIKTTNNINIANMPSAPTTCQKLLGALSRCVTLHPPNNSMSCVWSLSPLHRRKAEGVKKLALAGRRQSGDWGKRTFPQEGEGSQQLVTLSQAFPRGSGISCGWEWSPHQAHNEFLLVSQGPGSALAGR